MNNRRLITHDGRTIVGRITRLQKSMVKLIDAAGKTIDVLGPDIEEMHQSTISMMPDNLVFVDFAGAVFRFGRLSRNVALRGRSPVFAVPTSRSRSRESSSRSASLPSNRRR